MHRKRQTTIIFVCLAILAVYFLLQFAPASTRTFLALTAVPLSLLFTAFFIGYAKARESRLRYVYLILPVLITAIVLLALYPDIRRVLLRHHLETLGARVTLEFDDHHTYLPGWLKEELDWALLGRIKQVDLGHKPVPVMDLSSLLFAETIWFLNLEGSDVSRDGLNQLAGVLDAEVVNLSRTPADNRSLDAYGKMPSIKRIYAVKSNVTASNANDFRRRNPGIDLIINLTPPAGSPTTIKSTEP